MSAPYLIRGFLPDTDPLGRLSSDFATWQDTIEELPKLLAAGRARRTIAAMPTLTAAALSTRSELECAMGILSVLGHACIHESWRTGAAKLVPAAVALPWLDVARRVGRPPVLSYASHVLTNWRRLDADGPIALGNLAVLRNFYGGLDEDWFLLAHVDIEARAAQVLRGVTELRAGLQCQSLSTVLQGLQALGNGLATLHSTMDRIGEGCDPHVFFHRVQPFLHGFREVLYEGAEELGPQTWVGGSGAQSTIIPAVDAVLGIAHAADPLIQYLIELRRYMPPEHRAFLTAIEQGPAARAWVVAHREDMQLVAAFDRAIDELCRFREQHLKLSVDYIQRPASRGAAASPRGEVGTGGSPFMAYLKKHRDEASAHRIQPSPRGESASCPC